MKSYWVHEVVTDAASKKVPWDKALEAVQVVHASSLVRPTLRWPATVAIGGRPKRAFLCAKGFMNLVVRPVMVAVLGLLTFAVWHLNVPMPIGILLLASVGFSFVLAAWERAVAEFGMFAQTHPFLGAPASAEGARQWFQTMKAWYEHNHMPGPGWWTLIWGRRLRKAFQSVYAVVCRRACNGPLETPDVIGLSPEDQKAVREAHLLLEELPPEPSDYRLNRLVGPEIYGGYAILAIGVVLLATALAHAANPTNTPDVVRFARMAVDGLTPPPTKDDERDAGADSASQGQLGPLKAETGTGFSKVEAVQCIGTASTPDRVHLLTSIDVHASGSESIVKERNGAL